LNTSTKVRIIVVLVAILVVFNTLLYEFDKTVNPTIMSIAEAEVKKRTIFIINKSVLNEYSNGFDYDKVIKVEKDSEGNIIMLKADTLEMNKIACEVAIQAQNELEKEGDIDIKIPLAYAFKNNIFSNIGPSVLIKAEPIGNIEAEYSSQFESAGINQTRHKIYINLDTEVRIILPLSNDIVNVKSQIPFAETIIIGKVPSTTLDLEMKGAGVKLPDKAYSKK
jgi:sporulation protein YunB